MPEVLQVASRLAQSGYIRITRATKELNPLELAGGPVRLRRGKRFTD
jgi:hypothetical protein